MIRRWFGPWPIAAGGAFLVIVSLHDIYGVLSERWNRAVLVAHGREAQARVVRATGLESVLVEWLDEAGGSRAAESRAGKAFVRNALGATVAIRYDPASSREPVILSEVPRREQLNAAWLQSNLLALAGLSAVCVAAFLSMRHVRQARTAAARE